MGRIGGIAALVIALGATPASFAAMTPAPNEACRVDFAQLGPRPADRATVIQAMQRVEVCYAREAAATGSGTRDGVAILLSILAIIGALTVASLLFWNAKLYREIGIPVAVISAALIAVSSVLPDGGRARANSARAKVEQEKWRWTIRMARSNQMADDGKAIDEALAATDDLINRLSSGGAE